MCGVAGLFLTQADIQDPRQVLQGMTDRAAHRGPDDVGLWELPPDGGVRGGLGHRRLSIQDLTPAGKQPLAFEHLVLSFNGEIYNFKVLRAELERQGHIFATGTDTEVLLRAYAAWGHDCWQRLEGMWAALLVDTRARELVVCRDRFGIKPLYHHTFGGGVAWVSEPQQLRALPGQLAPDVQMLRQYVEDGHELSGRSFYERVRPWPAGTYGVMHWNAAEVPDPQPYWSPESIEPDVRTAAEASELMGATLRDATKNHMVSDAPICFALSGGLDSTALVTTARGLAPDATIRTFSVAFPGEVQDESVFAETAARALRAQPEFVSLSEAEFLSGYEAFLKQQDEPVGGPSVFAGYLLARRVRSHGIKVVLTGQGGDEVLEGYWQHYLWALARKMRRGAFWQVGKDVFSALGPQGNPALWGEFIPMGRRALGRLSTVRRLWRQAPNQTRIALLRDVFLPRLLRWDDRNMMAHSVENRPPFLDHRLVEALLRIPPDLKHRAGWTKVPLRDALRDELPPLVRDRRDKRGFEVPVTRWLAAWLRHNPTPWIDPQHPIWEFGDHARDVKLLGRGRSGARLKLEEVERAFRLINAQAFLEAVPE